MKKMIIILGLILLICGPALADKAPGKYHVTSLANTGLGSLRDMIDSANVNPGVDTIVFDISGTIELLTGLTSIDDDQTLILGSTAPGGAHSVVLDGATAGNQSGFVMNSDMNLIEGLTMINWGGRCILIDGNSNTIANCHIGVNEAGDTRSIIGNGIAIFGYDNLIGGCDESDRNLIVGGDNKVGIYLEMGSSNSVIGNYIGLSASGGALIDPPQTAHGVYLSFCDGPNYIGQEGCPPNFMANNSSGIYLLGSSANEIENNIIGLAANLNDTIPNNEGVTVNGTSEQNIIGPNNIIAGCVANGISFNASGSDSNIVILNTIVACDLNGIYLTSGANFNRIGGQLEGNTIIGVLQNGIYIYGSTSYTSVIDNQIGGGYDNEANGNSGDGIAIESNSNYNTISDNIISFNGGDGIMVNIGGMFNTFSRNAVFKNDGLGIDLADDGVTTNDPNDWDLGPNTLLNYPVIDSMLSSLGNFEIHGHMSDSGLVEFFIAQSANDSLSPVDPSGYGEAYMFIDSVSTDVDSIFVITLNDSLVSFASVTATATDKNGNTSEFCPNFDLIPKPLVISGYSPINLIVHDPVNDSIGKDADNVFFQTIVDATYDEDPYDIVTIAEPLLGEYIIEVIAETGAPPDATYSVGIRIDGSLESMLIVDQEVPTADQTDTYTYTVGEGGHFTNGDVNGDGNHNLTDILDLICCVYVDQGGPCCPDPITAGDANCDGDLNLTDILDLISYIYVVPIGQPVPCDH